MTRHAPALGWSMLTGAAFVASVGPLPVQLGFAILAIGVVGMMHGASDLAIVAPSHRRSFVALYLAVGITCLVWWAADPAIALPAFLIASAVHFGMEDAPDGSVVERIARGTSLIATPAALHAPALSSILALAGLSQHALPLTVGEMQVVGGLSAAGLLILALRRRDRRLLAGTLALLVLPPLVGFSLGFLILHALPQTSERRVQLGCATLAAYLRATAPVLLAALIAFAAAAIVLLDRDRSGVRSLFAAIAALAIPHLLVTPWFSALRPVPSPLTGRRMATDALPLPKSG